MEVQKWTRADDPETRCEFILTSTGNQCSNKRVEGTMRCPLHGANKKLQAQENASMRVYRLVKWRQRVGELADHDKIKSLREEIAILRILLEERLNSIDDAHELILCAQPISDLVMKIERVVSSCNKLEGQLGNMLDRVAVKNLAATLMQILAEKVNEFCEAHDISAEDAGLLLDAIATAFLETINPT